MALEILAEEKDRACIVKLEGKLDGVTTPILEKKIKNLMDEGKKWIGMDFALVDYLSSAGIRLLISLTKKLHSQEGKLVLFSLNSELFEDIKITGFDKVLNICKEESQALKKLI
ncbi:MAG TPA: STAS domain-containing protein [Chlamydiales bacterium]|nr:STAS domain-containing protein [Chlamydiales bacterium]